MSSLDDKELLRSMRRMIWLGPVVVAVSAVANLFGGWLSGERLRARIEAAELRLDVLDRKPERE